MNIEAITVLILLSGARSENYSSLLLGKGEVNKYTANCLLSMSAKYFVEKKALSGSIVIININSWNSTTQKTILYTIHSGMKYSVMVKDSYFKHKNASHFPEKAKNYMMILEDKSELERNILQLNKLPTWNPLAKAVVFYEIKPGEEAEDIVRNMIDKLAFYKLLKTIVILSFSDDNEVVSYTWKPYSGTNCGGACDFIYILDRCKDQRVIQINQAADMFPLDMRGCPLVVYTEVCEPYVMPPRAKIDNSIYSDEYQFDYGIEVNIMKIIAHFTNMTLQIRLANLSYEKGEIFADGNATGLYDLLRQERADVLIGNMQVDRVIRKWFDPSSPYMQDETTWCVPKPATASTWSNLVIIFEWSTWATTFAALIFVSFILHTCFVIENRKRTKWPTNSLLMTFSMLIGWGALFKPRNTAFRIVIITWLLFSINLSTSYESLLRSFLIHPRFEKQITTEAELLQSALQWGGVKSIRENFRNETGNSTSPLYKQYVTCDYTDCMKKTAFGKDFAVASSRRQADYQSGVLGRGASVMYCFEEGNIIYKYAVVILARKWYPMVNRFNGILRSITENGLIWKWYNEVIMTSKATGDSSDIAPLGMKHLLGAFTLLSLIHAFSAIVFLGELCAHLLRKRLHKILSRKKNKTGTHH